MMRLSANVPRYTCGVLERQISPEPLFCRPSLVPAACEKAAKWREALALLRDMQEAQLIVTGGTYTHVVKACTNAGEIGEARALLDEMRSNGMPVKKGTIAMVELQAERRSAQVERRSAQRPRDGGGFSSASDAAPPDTRGVVAAPRAIRAPGGGVNPAWQQQGAAPAWSDALPTTTACPSGTPPPASVYHQNLRPAADDEEEAGTSTDTVSWPAAEANTGSDGAAAAAAASPSVATTVPPPPSSPDTAAAVRPSARAAEMLAARPPRARSVRDFIQAVGSHSRNRRWAEILAGLDSAMADPNTKVHGDAAST